MEFKSLKIIHFSTHDIGGAGIAAYRFHKNLQSYGATSRMIVSKKNTIDSSVIELPKTKLNQFVFDKLSYLDNKLDCFDKKYYFFDKRRYPTISTDEISKNIDFNPDIIVLHWISEFISLDLIEKLAEKHHSKVYWYLMDMAPMTGGCHYAWDCTGYQNSCNNCPAIKKLYHYLPIKNLKEKKKIIDNIKISPMVGSSRLLNQINSSTLFKEQQKHLLLLGIDKEIFKPGNKTELRLKYHIPIEKKVIFCGASNLVEERKGFKYAIDAFLSLKNQRSELMENTYIITVGGLPDKAILKNQGLNHIHFDSITDEKKLAEIYQLSDIFLCPSIEDSGPMMINEALMCGTPAVAFEMGVASDLIVNYKNGFVADLKSSDSLKTGLEYLLNLNSPNFSLVSENARLIALESSSIHAQINGFYNIINN
jgi:glycosyltransferase involved in cell wall biosynthesis